jgi:biotin transport system substrate-specific component
MAVTLTTPNTILGVLEPKTQTQRLLSNIVLVVLGTLLLTASAKFKLPLPPVPFTLQTLAVALIAAGAGWRVGVATVALYLAEGLAGLPVFAGDLAGPAYFMGTTAGFLVGFLPMAWIIGRAADRGAAGNVALFFATMVLADAVDFAFGFGWLLIVANTITAGGAALPKWLQGNSLVEAAFNGAVKPFILWDALKMALAAMTVSGLWVAFRKRS